MKNYSYLSIIVILAIIVLLSVGRCTQNRKTASANFEVITDTVTYYTNTIGTQTASIKALQTDKKKLLNTLLKKDAEVAQLSKDFVKLSSITKYKTITHFDTIAITYKDTIPCKFKRSGIISTQSYSFNYQTNQNALKISNLTVPNTATIIIGTKRKWFLGKETLTTDITNSNPYIKVTEIKAAEVIVGVPWYKKWYIWLALGVTGGALMAN